jgi:hypothetical protein
VEISASLASGCFVSLSCPASTNPHTAHTLLAVQATSYFSWPSDHHDWVIKRSAVSLDASDEMCALPQTIHCHLDKDPVPDGAFVWDL